MVCEVDAAQVCWTAPDPAAVCDPCVDLETEDGAAAWAAAWQVAVSFVYDLTGGRWPGACWSERVRPCLPACGCHTRWACHCGAYNRLDLTGVFCLPVVDVIAVDVVDRDGAVTALTVDSGDVRLEWDGRRPILVLHRDNPVGWWPHQDLGAADGAASTWAVEVRTGVDPPPHVLYATAALANDIAAERAARGCSLSAAATRVTTRGVTFEKDPDQTGSGGVGWDMLEAALKRHPPAPVERFATPGGSVLAPTWHTVWGPTRIPDPEPDPGP